MSDKTMPSESGIYWARSKPSMQWFDLIVSVEGDSPMLYIDYVCDRVNECLCKAKPHDVLFGPKIEEPVVPEKEIVRG